MAKGSCRMLLITSDDEAAQQGDSEDPPPAALNELPGSPQRRDRRRLLEDDRGDGEAQPDRDPDSHDQGADRTQDGDHDGKHGDVDRQQDDDYDHDRQPDRDRDQRHEQADGEHRGHPGDPPCFGDRDLVAEQAMADGAREHAGQDREEDEHEGELERRVRAERPDELPERLSGLGSCRPLRDAQAQTMGRVELLVGNEGAADSVEGLDDRGEAERGRRVPSDQRERAADDVADGQRPERDAARCGSGGLTVARRSVRPLAIGRRLAVRRAWP